MPIYARDPLFVAARRASNKNSLLICSAILFCLVAVAYPHAAGGQAQQSAPKQSDGALLARQGNAPAGGLQPGTRPRPGPSSVGDECLRRRADWENNRPAWSFFWGFVFYLVVVLLLTYLRVTRTGVRLLISFIAAVILGPSLLALQMQDALKVCPSPPGFLGSMFSAPILIWTAAGVFVTVAVIFVIRYVIVEMRKFRRETSTP